MDKEVILLRHFEDAKIAEDYRDEDITEVGHEELEALAEIIRNNLEKTGCKSIILFTSPLKRSIETGQLVLDLLETKEIKTETLQDERLCSLRHGKYKSTDADTLNMTEHNAWLAFVDQSINKKDIFYRHGDPLIQNNTVEYPSLIGKFKSCGENQLEFTIRIYSFLMDLISVYDKHRCEEKMILICSHMAPLMRLYELSNLAKYNSNLAETPGTMYLNEWNQINDIAQDENAKNVMQTGGIGMLDIEDLMNRKEEIKSELAFLWSLHD